MENKSLVKWDLEHQMILFFITLSRETYWGALYMTQNHLFSTSSGGKYLFKI